MVPFQYLQNIVAFGYSGYRQSEIFAVACAEMPLFYKIGLIEIIQPETDPFSFIAACLFSRSNRFFNGYINGFFYRVR